MECEKHKDAQLFPKVHKSKWCKQCVSEQNERNKQYSKDELKKCARCPKICLKNDPTFLLKNGNYGKTCKKTREEKQLVNRNYKDDKLKENPEEFKAHLRELSKNQYKKDSKNEDYVIKKRNKSKEYKQNNPEKIKQQSANYRANLKN